MISTQPAPVNRRGGAVPASRCAVGHCSAPWRRFVMDRIRETRTASDQHRYTPAVHSRPVFTDPSGRRRRAMRRIGLLAAAALAICLGAVMTAMAGGPAAPFTNWAAPQPPAAATHDATPIRAPAHGPTGASPSSQPAGLAPVPSASAGSAPPASGSATPRSTASGTAAASSTSPPVPTNPAGRTPPGHTKSARPGNPHGI
jgi:hypothetical protein